MRIGLAYDLKETVSLAESAPEDGLEEFDSLATIETITAAIEAEGHSVVRLGGGREFLNRILHENVDLVFNIAEGRGTYRSREAQAPAVLEMLGVPYSGSDPQCLAICLDKPLTKRVIMAAGISTPKWRTITSQQELWETSWEELPFPAIVKPAYEGSSKGVHLDSLVGNSRQLLEAVEKRLQCYRQPVVVEEFIAGDEVTVGLLGNSPPVVLGMMRILPKSQNDYFVYSVEVKRDWQTLVDYECPAQLTEEVLEKLKVSSLKVFEILGCRDLARLDFRVSPEGIPYFLEINPLPGLGDYSDLVIMTVKLGWRHEALIRAVLNAALERYSLCVRR